MSLESAVSELRTEDAKARKSRERSEECAREAAERLEKSTVIIRMYEEMDKEWKGFCEALFPEIFIVQPPPGAQAEETQSIIGRLLLKKPKPAPEVPDKIGFEYGYINMAREETEELGGGMVVAKITRSMTRDNNPYTMLDYEFWSDAPKYPKRLSHHMFGYYVAGRFLDRGGYLGRSENLAHALWSEKGSFDTVYRDALTKVQTEVEFSDDSLNDLLQAALNPDLNPPELVQGAQSYFESRQKS